MNNQHTIIYVMRHIDIGGHIEIPCKKVGITGQVNATLTSRLQQISNTKSPIKAQCICAWKHIDAKAVETAMHLLLDDNRVEGELFYDKDDTLVERMQPIMKLLGAEEITIEGAEDSYTKNILEKENESKSASNKVLLGEISELLKDPLRTSISKGGLTIFSDKTNLTYSIAYRKSGKHRILIGRSKEIYEQLSNFLDMHGYDIEQSSNGYVVNFGKTADELGELINLIESSFIAN